MKTVKVDHVVLTLNLNPLVPREGSRSREEINNMINVRLAEGYDDVEITPIRTNYDERQQATDLVSLYVFKKYEGISEVEAEHLFGKKSKKEKEPVAA